MEILNRYSYDPQRDLLGKGGFATVYKAYDRLLDITVALKFFHAGNATDKYNVINEIRRVITLSHPNIVKYFGVETLTNRDVHGMTEEIQVGIMEYVEEGQMKTFLNRHPLMQVELTELLIGILEGLKYLHSQGIIHRDVKPQNILLGRDKQNKLIAKIADFGISKNIDSGHTSSSLLLGTVEYMAPEQFNPERYGINKKVSYNVDVWAFGITAYYLITGEHLFGARTGETSPGELINKIVHVDNLESKLAHLQEPFKTLIAKCIIPDAKTRTSNIDELIAILRGNAVQVHTSITVNVTAPPNAAGQETIILPKNISSEETKILPQPPRAKLVEPVQEKAAPKPKTGKSKKSLALISVLLLISIAAGAWFFYYPQWKEQQAQTELEEKRKQDAADILQRVERDMLLVEGGSFIMGSDLLELAMPSHWNEVDSFRLMKYEVTRDLWNRIMADNRFPGTDSLDYPANNVSWNEAVAFVDKLNELNNKYGNKALYRLPLEEEWEYAYQYMDDSTSLGVNDFGWNVNNSGGKIHPVGKKQHTGIGFYDLLGNVYEWCQDTFDVDGTDKKARILRGGDVVNEIYFVNPKIRNAEFPDKRSETFGFRIAQNIR